MEKQFIPYEQALALKELGFDEPCLACYLDSDHQFCVKLQSGNKEFEFFNNTTFVINNECVSAPLWQQTFDWFRDNHNLHSCIAPVYEDETKKTILYWFWIQGFDNFDDEDVNYNTPEEARLACLDRLIKLAKDNEEKILLKKLSICLDGGTKVYIEPQVKADLKSLDEASECQKYYLDYRIGTTTEGELFDRYTDINIYKKRAIEYCENNNINFVGFRYEAEPIQKDKPKKISSDRTDLKVLVKEYKGRLLIETINPEDDKDIDFIGNNGSVIGCTLNNLKRLGISAEAYIILSKVKRGRDDIGDLCGEKDNFSWIGRRNTVLGPKIVGSKYYQTPSQHTIIDNVISEEVMSLIDEAEKGKEIDYKDIPFDLWIEFTKDRTYIDGKYENLNTYSTLFNVHEKHFYDENITTINAPEKAVKTNEEDWIDVKASIEDKHDIADLIFHNIFGEPLQARIAEKVLADGEEESEIDKLLREFREGWGDFGNYNKITYKHKVNETEIWDYVNSFFDLGFSNNIMNPSDDYFRLSYNGTIGELKELLSKFKLIK